MSGEKEILLFYDIVLSRADILKNNKFPHYWICVACAKERGGTWPKGHVATVALKTCQYCNGNNHEPDQLISPWVDYDWTDIKTKHLRD